MEILLLHPGGLGDIILSLPATRLIRTKYPAARITLAANLDHVMPVAGVYADAMISLSSLPLHNLYSAGSVPDPDVRFWRSFDRVISWTGSGDPVFIRTLTAVHPNAYVGSWKPGPCETRHVSQLFIDSLEPDIGPGNTSEFTPIHLDPAQIHKGRQWLLERDWNGSDTLVTIHPGAGSRTKRWPLTRFTRLVHCLAVQQERKVLIVEGPAESGIAAQVAKELPGIGLIVAEALPLKMTAAVIAASRLFVGNDSGVAHLAAALGIPSVVLFGPTLPRHWAPLGPHVAVLWNPEACSGCGGRTNEHTCLENIAVADVIEKISVLRALLACDFG